MQKEKDKHQKREGEEKRKRAAEEAKKEADDSRKKYETNMANKLMQFGQGYDEAKRNAAVLANLSYTIMSGKFESLKKK
ncbi:MAG: hypothetical protein LBT90_03060 [Holosporaceae bacterium]|jgi:translation initiation factor 2B subunit (eIF-2B alpha/beta/delta family)|nr:hypothetical protein [Holosporaceae bacterium]